MDKKFRKAYIVQNTGHDFSSLLEMCDELVFVTTGYETEDQLVTSISKSLVNFDPSKDVLVPVGNVAANLLVGIVLQKWYIQLGICQVAMYQDKKYHLLATQ